jgi:single-stranded DNA-binding protein
MKIKPRNKVELIGQLTAPLQHDRKTGITKVTLSLSTGDLRSQDAESSHGGPHTVVAYGKVAERLLALCEVGVQLLIDGRLRTANRQVGASIVGVSEVVVEDFNLLARSPSANADDPQPAEVSQ